MIKSLVLSLAAGLFLLGCSNSQHHEGNAGHEQHMQADESVKPPEAGVSMRKARADEAGIDAVCPVMGTEFTVEEGGLAADYKGKSYYLCCPGCIEPFKNNPEKYIE